ncbi:hypothetical protein K435DRAFT_463032 [Dendrothele bispora CBS 962.96]|uniref:Uncharacterized protein n=1 Tax=Dendrothele bispora (strain CBS 962.96) TaxID=1314807 RepID=A0A4V4HC64_DENBC|nr:hypothetical protein K435DRAFT_463032 [Dendrothele bispora CBS 962.96]
MSINSFITFIGGQAVAINSDESGSEQGMYLYKSAQLQLSYFPMHTHFPETSVTSKSHQMSKERQEDDDDSSVDENDLEIEDRAGDLDAERFLEQEAPVWTALDGDQRRKDSSNRFRSRASSVSTTDLSKDVVLPSDTEGQLTEVPDDEANELSSDEDNDDADDGELEDELEPLLESPTKRISERAARKLQGELPVVSKKSFPASHVTSQKTTDNTQTQTPDLDEIEWLPRTDIVLRTHDNSTQSHKLSLKGQSSPIKAVIGRARKLGAIDIISDHSICPLGKGLKRVAAQVLVRAADELGYNGEGDIAHRLEEGDVMTYIKPMVSQRIILERKALKLPAATITTALGLDNSPECIEEAGALVKDVSQLSIFW